MQASVFLKKIGADQPSPQISFQSKSFPLNRTSWALPKTRKKQLAWLHGATHLVETPEHAWSELLKKYPEHFYTRHLV